VKELPNAVDCAVTPIRWSIGKVTNIVSPSHVTCLSLACTRARIAGGAHNAPNVSAIRDERANSKLAELDTVSTVDEADESRNAAASALTEVSIDQ
jgi:hypothetical protein